MLSALASVVPAEVDVLVIGAGVAGAVAALAAASVHRAHTGARPRVLLAERSTWPREKVCGCCLGGGGISALESLGVSRDNLRELGHALTSAQIRCSGGLINLPLSGGMVISRGALDSLLVRAAEARGVQFLPACQARVLMRWADGWRVGLKASGDSQAKPSHICAKTVIVADGLGGHSLDDLECAEMLRPRIWRRSYMGLGATAQWGAVCDASGSDAVPNGRVVLCTGAGGYLGLARLRSGAVDLAAAIDTRAVKDAGSPQAALLGLLSGSGLTVNGAWPARMAGTALLTRRRQTVAMPGLLIVGDAAGYVEPFTGEGMTWAARGGAQAGMLAATCTPQLAAESWAQWHKGNVISQQRTCRVIARGLRVSALASAAARVVSSVPAARKLALRIAASLSAPSRELTRLELA